MWIQIVITVMSASNVIPGKFHGATNPYCTVQMDKLQFVSLFSVLICPPALISVCVR